MLSSPSMVILETPVTNQGNVRFDHWMDETVTPAMGNLSAIVDGTPKVLTSISWGTDNELRCGFAAPAPVTDLSILLDTTDANLRDTDGIVAVAPQSVFNIA